MNKVTLITGATSGIGFELSKIFAKNSDDLLLVARNEDRLLDTKQFIENKFKVNVYIVKADLKDKKDIEKIISFVKDNNLVVKNLVNNAGFGSFGYFHEIDKNWDLDMIKVNISALTILSKTFIPSMIKRGEGGILNVASTAGFQGGPFMAVYYATKAYVISLSEALSEELRGTGVTVSALCPGAVETQFQKIAKVKKSPLAKKNIMKADIVAQIGYDAFKRGKTIIVPGIKNKLLIQSLRILPRNLVSKIIKKVNQK